MFFFCDGRSSNYKTAEMSAVPISSSAPLQQLDTAARIQ
jgi:hypothetical protein